MLPGTDFFFLPPSLQVLCASHRLVYHSTLYMSRPKIGLRKCHPSRSQSQQCYSQGSNSGLSVFKAPAPSSPALSTPCLQNAFPLNKSRAHDCLEIGHICLCLPMIRGIICHLCTHFLPSGGKGKLGGYIYLFIY